MNISVLPISHNNLSMYVFLHFLKDCLTFSFECLFRLRTILSLETNAIYKGACLN